jgi:hypothetical protein
MRQETQLVNDHRFPLSLIKEYSQGKDRLYAILKGMQVLSALIIVVLCMTLNGYWACLTQGGISNWEWIVQFATSSFFCLAMPYLHEYINFFESLIVTITGLYATFFLEAFVSRHTFSSMCTLISNLVCMTL